MSESSILMLSALAVKHGTLSENDRPIVMLSRGIHCNPAK